MTPDARAQVAAIDAVPRMPRPWLPCGTCEAEPAQCTCDGEPPDLGDGPDRAGHRYWTGP